MVLPVCSANSRKAWRALRVMRTLECDVFLSSGGLCPLYPLPAGLYRPMPRQSRLPGPWRSGELAGGQGANP
jgi:hypothetical protein